MIEVLLRFAEQIAKRRYDGHFTIMCFTTHWKVMFGTPNLDIDGRKEVRQLTGFPKLEQALEAAILGQIDLFSMAKGT